VVQDLSVFLPSRGLVVAGQGIPAIYPRDFLNFSPRVGFAYQPRDSGNLVVRGFYGIFFDTPPIIPFLDNVFLLNNVPTEVEKPPLSNDITRHARRRLVRDVKVVLQDSAW
jgi:hypothetical protein